MSTFAKLFVKFHTALYRLTGGRVMGSFGKAPVLLLTTTGRKSGKKRTTPLLYVEDAGAYFVVASSAGSPKHPAWYLNLVAHPETELQIRNRKLSTSAETSATDEKERLWVRFQKMYPDYDTYQKRTERDIPVVKLTPRRPRPV